MNDEGRFQVAVGAIIARDGKILLIRRAITEIGGDIWEFPIGRLKQFELFQDGLSREVAEECGITQIRLLKPVSVFSFMRGGNTADHEVKGINFACETTQSTVILSHEHTDYRWLTIDEAIALVEHKGIKADLVAYKQLTS